MPEPKENLESLRTETPQGEAGARSHDVERSVVAYQQNSKRLREFYEGDDDLNSKLAIAISRGDAEQASRLIGQGADVNLRQPGRLPLIHEAVGLGHTVIVDVMLATGRCDLTVRDEMGRLPSQVADLILRDGQLAERLAEEQARQFQAKGIDPRRPDHPDYGNWKWEG